MPKLYSSRQIAKTLERLGFVFVSQRGSHMKYHCTARGRLFTVIVPANRPEVPRGTFRSILRQSQLEESDFDVK